MKALKTILIILVLLFGVLLILGAMADKNYRYERSVTIAAPVSTVWSHVNSLAAMDKWSPWNEKDTAMKKSMEGEDGKPGAVAKWEGNSDVGKGEQKIMEVKENEKITTELRFMEPWENVATGEVALTGASDSTKVTWSISGENGLMGRVFGLFMDMDAMIGPDFEKGLGYLKTQVESEGAKKIEEMKAMVARYDIKSGERAAMTYVGVRKRVKWEELKQFFGESFGAAMGAMGAAKVKPSGPPSSVYFEWDEVNKEADLLAGFPIADGDKGKVQGMTEHATPAGEAYWIAYMGDYEKMEPAHMALSSKLELEGRDLNENVVEEYITDPMNEPDTAKWLTNIIWLAKAKGAAN